jgi:glycosyltransferase involved in cell wall biosynthesis
LKNIRVLMIGPGEGIMGGISTLVEALLPFLEKQVSLFYLPSVKWRQQKDSGKLSSRNLLIVFSQYIRFLVALFRFRPHIVHLHTSQGIAWLKDTFFVLTGKAFHARVILHMHGGNFDTIYRENPRILQSYTRMILGLADAVISVSTEWKLRLAKLIPVDRVLTFKNCLDIQTFPTNGACKAGQAVNVLFLGRIGPQKGAFDLIEAIHCLQPGRFDLHVWMVGPEERDGDFQYAQHLLEGYQLADTCEVLGPLHREKVLQLFHEASVFVLPSYYEGLPMALLEALAAGLPVIATSVGGIPEVVQDTYNGFLISPGNILALAGALAKLGSDTDVRKIMGQRSREIAERELDVRPYADKMTTLYSTLVRL